MASVVLPQIFGSRKSSSPPPPPPGPSPAELARREEEKRQKEEAERKQREAEQKAEAKAEQKKLADERRRGRQATILTGAEGLSESAPVGRTDLAGGLKKTLG
ncbi:MAG: hypothetical protein ACOCVM_08915 [Desulfovibrionaceae bacterium]